MMLNETAVNGVFEIEPKVFGDNRGWFYESYSKEKFEIFRAVDGKEETCPKAVDQSPFIKDVISEMLSMRGLPQADKRATD